MNKKTQSNRKVQTGQKCLRLAWSLSEIAESLGISIGTLRKEIAMGRLQVRKICRRRVVVMDSDLRRYLELLPDRQG